MTESLKKFVKYLYVYKIYGIFLYMQIYWFKKSRINLKGYGPIWLRPKSTDVEVFNQMFIYKQYSFFPVQGAVRTVVDLGGNNGLSALFFHRRYPDATIYVLEPDKSNFEALKKNTAGIDKIIAINKAIWKENGTVNLSSTESWAIRIDNEGANVAEAISMKSLMESYKIDQIDVLKIDIEGAEKEIFESSTDFLANTRNLTIELHDWMRPGCAEPFFRSLNNYSYKYNINHENTVITDLKPKTAYQS